MEDVEHEQCSFGVEDLERTKSALSRATSVRFDNNVTETEIEALEHDEHARLRRDTSEVLEFFRFGSQIFEVPEDYDEDQPPDLGPRDSVQTATDTETGTETETDLDAAPLACRDMETQTEAPFGEACSAETVQRQDLRDLMAKYALMRARYAVRVQVLEEQLLAMHDPAVSGSKAHIEHKLHIKAMWNGCDFKTPQGRHQLVRARDNGLVQLSATMKQKIQKSQYRQPLQALDDRLMGVYRNLRTITTNTLSKVWTMAVATDGLRCPDAQQECLSQINECIMQSNIMTRQLGLWMPDLIDLVLKTEQELQQRHRKSMEGRRECEKCDKIKDGAALFASHVCTPCRTFLMNRDVAMRDTKRLSGGTVISRCTICTGPVSNKLANKPGAAATAVGLGAKRGPKRVVASAPAKGPVNNQRDQEPPDLKLSKPTKTSDDQAPSSPTGSPKAPSSPKASPRSPGKKRKKGKRNAADLSDTDPKSYKDAYLRAAQHPILKSCLKQPRNDEEEVTPKVVRTVKFATDSGTDDEAIRPDDEEGKGDERRTKGAGDKSRANTDTDGDLFKPISAEDILSGRMDLYGGDDSNQRVVEGDMQTAWTRLVERLPTTTTTGRPRPGFGRWPRASEVLAFKTPEVDTTTQERQTTSGREVEKVSILAPKDRPKPQAEAHIQLLPAALTTAEQASIHQSPADAPPRSPVGGGVTLIRQQQGSNGAIAAAPRRASFAYPLLSRTGKPWHAPKRSVRAILQSSRMLYNQKLDTPSTSEATEEAEYTDYTYSVQSGEDLSEHPLIEVTQEEGTDSATTEMAAMQDTGDNDPLQSPSDILDSAGLSQDASGLAGEGTGSDDMQTTQAGMDDLAPELWPDSEPEPPYSETPDSDLNAHSDSAEDLDPKQSTYTTFEELHRARRVSQGRGRGKGGNSFQRRTPPPMV
uniref:Uncharacterized protein n=1 Tax=Eutreptiella gymnastica TaxID=73025 RepID=A0A7S1IU00_9EUGL|mmetsp:Transcript_42531/g.76346  ORF Transcript_42531/g.76346 Transcript_42531/m.76346 type:complete len:927 (+) Transcript_42531:198-2978(+)